MLQHILRLRLLLPFLLSWELLVHLLRLLLAVQARQDEAGVADAEVVNSYPDATGWELGSKAVSWQASDLAFHWGRSPGPDIPPRHNTSCPLGCLLKAAGNLQDVLEEGGDVDPLARLRDGISSQLEVPYNPSTGFRAIYCSNKCWIVLDSLTQ